MITDDITHWWQWGISSSATNPGGGVSKGTPPPAIFLLLSDWSRWGLEFFHQTKWMLTNVLPVFTRKTTNVHDLLKMDPLLPTRLFYQSFSDFLSTSIFSYHFFDFYIFCPSHPT